MSSLGKVTENLLRKLIREIILEKKKPGGGITKIGAKKIVDPSSADIEIRNALADEQGSVSDAAEKLDVSTRTLYNYIDDDSRLKRVKDKFEKEDEKE